MERWQKAVLGALMALVSTQMVTSLGQTMLRTIRLMLQRLELRAFTADGRFLMDLCAHMAPLPVWLSAIVVVRAPLRLYLIHHDHDRTDTDPDTDPDPDGHMAEVYGIERMTVPLNTPSMELRFSDLQVRLNPRQHPQFRLFTRALVQDAVVQCRLLGRVDVWALGLLPLFGLTFDPQMDILGMRALSDVTVVQLQVRHGTALHIELETIVRIHNPSNVVLDVGRASFHLHIPSDSDDHHSDQHIVVGTVLMEQLVLEPGTNLMKAIVLFHPPPVHKPAIALLSRFLQNHSSPVLIKAHAHSLDRPHHADHLTYLAHAMADCLTLHTALPGWETPLLAMMKLTLSPWKQPSSSATAIMLNMTHMVLGQEVLGSVVIRNGFGDWIRVVWIKGDVFLSGTADTSSPASHNDQTSKDRGLQIGRLDVDARRDGRFRRGRDGSVSSDVVAGSTHPTTTTTASHETTTTTPSTEHHSTPSESSARSRQRFHSVGSVSRFGRRTPPRPGSAGSIVTVRVQSKHASRPSSAAARVGGGSTGANSGRAAGVSKRTWLASRPIRDDEISEQPLQDSDLTQDNTPIDNHEDDDDHEETEGDLVQFDYLLAVPPHATALSPSLPVKMVMNTGAIQALMQAAVGRLTVDVEMTLGCLVGNYFIDGVEYVQRYVPVEIS